CSEITLTLTLTHTHTHTHTHTDFVHQSRVCKSPLNSSPLAQTHWCPLQANINKATEHQEPLPSDGLWLLCSGTHTHTHTHTHTQEFQSAESKQRCRALRSVAH